MDRIKAAKLIVSVFVSIGAGLIGVPFNIANIETWYVYLNRPFFAPPNWLFEPVWSVLYLLIGISFFLIWKKGIKSKASREAAYLFLTQLGLNALWSPVFFGLKNLWLALVVIVFMWIYIYKTIKAFKKIDSFAAYLLYPYLLWVSFATLLNFAFAYLN